MKILAFILTFMLVTWGVFSSGAATSDKAPPDDSRMGFLEQWRAFHRSEAYKDPASDLSLEYVYETRNWRGDRKTERRTLHFGKGADNLFGTLEAMKEYDEAKNEYKRLRNVEASPEHEDVYTMVLLDAMTLKEQGKEDATVSANTTCQFFQGLPRRFIFLAETPRRWKTRQVRIVYTWNYHSYEYEDEDEEQFWVPVEIVVDQLVKKGRRDIVISQRWTLLRILAVEDTSVSTIQVITTNDDGEN